MTRSMSKAKQANVPAIYPLKAEHKKPEHTKPQVIEGKVGNEQNVPEPTDNVGDGDEFPEVNEPQKSRNNQVLYKKNRVLSIKWEKT